MRCLAAVGWLAAASCGRLNFADLGRGGSGDAATDAPADAGTDCWAAWRAGTVQLTAPAPVSELDTPATETNPSLADHGRTLYFDRGGTSNRDVFVATRPARGQPFGPPAALTSIDAPTEDDTRLSVSADGLVGVFTSISSAVNYRMYQTQRASEADPFGAPTETPFPQIDNDPGHNEVDAELTTDGLRLYFAPNTAGVQRIMLASRAAVADPFGAPVAVAGVAVGKSTQDPTISPDELVIAFSSADVAGNFTIYYASRPDPTAAFGSATPMPGLGSSTIDGDPELADDGCEVFFDSERSAAADLFVMQVVP